MTTFNRWAFALTLPAVLTTLALYVAPITQVLTLSVTDPRPGLGNYEGLMTSNAVAKVAATTLNVSLLTTIFTIAGAYAIAFGLVHMRVGPRRLAMFLVLVPFWVSVLVRAFSWITILRREGVLNSALSSLGLISEPLNLVYNRIGVVIGMVHYMLPFAVLLIFANLSGIDRRIMQAARSLGARPATIFWRIWLPLSVPGLAVASVFVFIYSLGFLITPALLGAGRTVMIAEFISVQMKTLRWGVATALSVLLLLLVALSVLALMRRPALRAAFEGRPDP
ncbi:putative spermidine/putrescine transport system permease protein [Faunimonas pinastri]|uniref:Putative spermidine/putrescine transport system permease protein n=1 Tax=Faunimonas pinastri TaxID=1855383 RepID=A0A1H9E1C2_9HYPH|nr:ABC transporter permease [Faunimonas pinastri]SEQ18728.1 putative spermidine/putrescine transport system permease protein [Faunimonas pinastri]